MYTYHGTDGAIWRSRLANQGLSSHVLKQAFASVPPWPPLRPPRTLPRSPKSHFASRRHAPHARSGKPPLQTLSPHSFAHLLDVPQAQSFAAFVVAGLACSAQHFVHSAAVFAAFGSQAAVFALVVFGGGALVFALLDVAGFGAVWSAAFLSSPSSFDPAMLPFESALSFESVLGSSPHAIVSAARAETAE